MKKWKEKQNDRPIHASDNQEYRHTNRLLRTEQKLSIRDLAKKSAISKSQVSDITLGNKIPNLYTLYLICTALGISLSDFFDFEDSVIKLRGKEAILVKIYRELSPMSQDALIKLSKCMR